MKIVQGTTVQPARLLTEFADETASGKHSKPKLHDLGGIVRDDGDYQMVHTQIVTLKKGDTFPKPSRRHMYYVKSR